MNRIAYIDKTSLVDWDGRVVATIFLSGCNFRCSYCHNKELWECRNGVSMNEVLSFLRKRRDWLDGVVITGGEPLLDNNVIRLLKAIKKLRYDVKLDTNGSKPALLEEVINRDLVDYVAMDVKWHFERYSEITKVNVNAWELKKSVQIIKESGIEYEFRTTIFDGMSVDDIVNVAMQVAPARLYVLQAGRKDERVIVGNGLLREAKKRLEDIGKFGIVKVSGYGCGYS